MRGWLVLALVLAACNDSPNIYPITGEHPVVHGQHPGALAVAHGAAIAVQPSTIQEELEGSKAVPVTGMRSNDPATLEVRATSHAYDVENSPSPNGLSWVLVGVAPGSTKVRLYRDDDEVGRVTVDVVAQTP